ncbi:MAG: metal ABC transporter substrate-binding protein, partial [Lachnospiraceae bacterium]|nr:metal ABC transporter substrate-binding protein [Lachnospiraceae bacterium]
MKKISVIFLASVLALYCICGCGSVVAAGASAAGGDDKIQVVTTIFPEYDWVMSVLGENPANAEVTMLLDNGVDLHSYQPTAEDIMKISTCDLFIYVGGESDGWVDDALKEAVNKDMVVINLLETLGDTVKEEEVVEGMQHDHDHEHEHGHEEGEEHEHEEGEEHEHEEGEEHEHEEGEEHEHEEDEEHEHEEGEEHEHEHEHEEGEPEYDEHVWLSLRNSQKIVSSISEALQSIDKTNAESYKSNAKAYNSKLAALDEEYTKAVSDGNKNVLLFGDRFPFRYLTDDYGLNYYAAFVGCSAETEASFETVTFLADKVDELSLDAVLTIEKSDGKIAQTIIENTESKDQKILTMDSLQSTTG